MIEELGRSKLNDKKICSKWVKGVAKSLNSCHRAAQTPNGYVGSRSTDTFTEYTTSEYC